MSQDPTVTKGQRAFLEAARDVESDRPRATSAALGAAVVFGLLAVLLGSIIAAMEFDRPVLAVIVYFTWWAGVATAIALIRWRREP